MWLVIIHDQRIQSSVRPFCIFNLLHGTIKIIIGMKIYLYRFRFSRNNIKYHPPGVKIILKLKGWLVLTAVPVSSEVFQFTGSWFWDAPENPLPCSFVFLCFKIGYGTGCLGVSSDFVHILMSIFTSKGVHVGMLFTNIWIRPLTLRRLRNRGFWLGGKFWEVELTLNGVNRIDVLLVHVYVFFLHYRCY